MVFGYSKNIFPYPAVQYIPINYFDITITASQIYSRPNIYIFKELKKAKQLAKHYGIFLTNSKKLKTNELLVMAINSQVEDIKYRAYRVTMLTSKTENLIHIFKIKTDYFYKKKLLFVLYDLTGEELASKNINL